MRPENSIRRCWLTDVERFGGQEPVFGLYARRRVAAIRTRASAAHFNSIGWNGVFAHEGQILNPYGIREITVGVRRLTVYEIQIEL